MMNGTLYNMDQGVETVLPLTKINCFKDRAGMAVLIHNTK